MSKVLLVVLMGLTMSAVVAGCGDGDSETDSSLTKAEFIKQADAICRQGDSRIQREYQAFAKENDITQPSDKEGEELVRQVLLPNLESQAEEIRELGAPSGDEEQIEAILTALGNGIEEAEEKPKHVFNGHTAPFAEANELAAEYGLEACGQG